MRLFFKAAFAIMICLGSMQNVSANDFRKIYNRMCDAYISNPSKESVNTLLEKMNDDGSFNDLDYQTTDGSTRKHLQNMKILAAAFKSADNAYHGEAEVKKAYLNALSFWLDNDNQPKNWWFRYIAFPKELSQSVILMADEIKRNKELFNKTIKYLRWSYENANAQRLTGANGADIIIGSITASILTENDTQMINFRDKMTELLQIQPVEGIQVDYLFAQHCGNGRQLYFTSYGKEFVNSVLYYLEFCDGTKYQTEGVQLLQDLFINGVQWVFFNKQYDPNNAGRYISCDQFSKQIKELTDRLSQLNGPSKNEMKKVSKRISGENSLEGNRMFWRFDYMINRRPAYMTSSRMTSTRTVGNEAGNKDGEFNYYASNGVNYIFVTGKEYDREYFKKFNNRQYPGITAEQDNEPLPIPDWGKGGGNNNAFAGGVSDSIIGACGMILDRRGVQANKAWFYFDDEYVCLGAGINNTKGKAPVYTTLNQCNADGPTQYSQGGKVSTLKDQVTLTGVDWIIHGKVGYFNLSQDTKYRIVSDGSLFSLNINHGINPQNKTYAYLVKPGISSSSNAAKYQNSVPVKIIANTESIQAVRHEKLKVTEAIFYQAGKLDMGNGNFISVNAPCALLWNEEKNKLSIANPRCESENPPTVQVTLNADNHSTTLTFDMPQKEMSGSSVSQIIE